MFCSLKFLDIASPVVAHAQWNPQYTSGLLRFVTDKTNAAKLLKELPPAEVQSLAAHIEVLPCESKRPGLVTIEEDAALSLTNGLVAYSTTIGAYEHRAVGSELLGFWHPPEDRKPGAALLMWFEDAAYKTRITYSKERVRDFLDELSWLPLERQQKLLQQVGEWNMPRRSSRECLNIDGAVAELLCKVSVVQKVGYAMKKALM